MCVNSSSAIKCHFVSLLNVIQLMSKNNVLRVWLENQEKEEVISQQYHEAIFRKQTTNKYSANRPWQAEMSNY